MVTPSFNNQGYSNIAGTPTSTLAVSLYTLHTTFFDPIKKSSQPLPSHVWGLYHLASKKFLSVGKSDKNGQCVLMKPQTLTAGSYSLQLYPLPDPTQQAYVSAKEAWIDLDTGDWLDPTLVPTTTPALLKNKVVRIPTWTTDRKATVFGGDFVDAPPKSKATFGKTGLLKSTDIEVYGSAATPWEMQIDFNWIRSHVSYLFINWNTGKEETLPPGALVEIKDATGNRLGAGGAIDPNDGTAYVLVAATQDKWKGLHVGFGLPLGSRIDVSAAKPSPDTRLTADGTVPDDRNTRVTLPKVWHSLGQNAFYAPTVGGTASSPPKKWDDLRKDIGKDGAATEPVLTFHLNDVALVTGGKLATIAKNTRLTFFDHLLMIQNPDPKMPHLTTGTFSSPLIPARTAYAVDPSPAPTAPTLVRDLGTRLVNTQGSFFDLEEAFVTGTAGTTPLVGARAAVAGAHPIAPYTSGCPYVNGEGRYELHAVPVPNVKDPVTSLELTHGLVYVGSLVSGQAAVGAAAKAYAGNTVSNFYTLLTQAAVRWSQGHPGVAGAGNPSPQKDYRVVSKNAGKRGRGVLRLRYFFNERTDNHHTFAIKLTVDTAATDDTRSFVQGSQMTYYDSAVKSDSTPGTPVNDLDSAPAPWHTLAHEFGHVLGLPDEYYEPLDPSSVAPNIGFPAPFLPRYAQYDGWKSGARPYWQDNKAIMNNNQLLRLRHVWHHVRGLGSDAKFKSLQDAPFVGRNDSYPSGGLEYATPAGKFPPGQTIVGDLNNPYTPLFRGKLPSADVIIFPVGEDEGTVEGMFPTAGPTFATIPSGSRFDALVVVRTFYRFVFDAAIPKPAQWTALFNFHSGYYDANYVETFRFQLVGGTVLTRLAIMFAPHYVAGTGTPPDWVTADPTHFTLNIKQAAVDPKKNPLLLDKPGSKLTLGMPDLAAIPLLRMTLGGQAWTSSPPDPARTVDASSIVVMDLGTLAAEVDRLLGEPAGTRTAVAL